MLRGSINCFKNTVVGRLYSAGGWGGAGRLVRPGIIKDARGGGGGGARSWWMVISTRHRRLTLFLKRRLVGPCVYGPETYAPDDVIRAGFSQDFVVSPQERSEQIRV